MTIEGQQGIQPPGVDPIGGPGAPQQPTQVDGAEGVAFRRLLEQLTGLQGKQPTGEETGVDGDDPGTEGARKLREALHQADKDYATAMDLRRQLEEAFRRQHP